MATSNKKRTWNPHFGYSTNVHKTSSLRDIQRFIDDYTVRVKQRVFPREEAGLELHLSMKTGAELLNKKALEAFREFLAARSLYLFSVNAFPLKPFHTKRVKEKVYSPSWTERDRAHWTVKIAEILAALLPPDTAGSISTLGGAFRRKEHGPATFRRLAKNFLKVVDALAGIERERGKKIVLAVEPEPETTFETADDCIRFFEEYLLPAAFEDRQGRRTPRSKVEEKVRRHFTINVDTCHFSVLFEDPVRNLRALKRAGIGVGKLHVTNAVRLRNPFRARLAYADLRSMHEQRYFHQFCGIDKRRRTVWRDLDLDRLPTRLVRGRHPEVEELRCHYHVPLFLKRFRRLETTQEETAAAVSEVRRTGLTQHLVVETYTWPLLSDDESLVQGIAREFRWLLQALAR